MKAQKRAAMPVAPPATAPQIPARPPKRSGGSAAQIAVARPTHAGTSHQPSVAVHTAALRAESTALTAKSPTPASDSNHKRFRIPTPVLIPLARPSAHGGLSPSRGDRTAVGTGYRTP